MIPRDITALQINLWTHTCRCPNCSAALLRTLLNETGAGCLN